MLLLWGHSNVWHSTSYKNDVFVNLMHLLPNVNVIHPQSMSSKHSLWLPFDIRLFPFMHVTPMCLCNNSIYLRVRVLFVLVKLDKRRNVNETVRLKTQTQYVQTKRTKTTNTYEHLRTLTNTYEHIRTISDIYRHHDSSTLVIHCTCTNRS